MKALAPAAAMLAAGLLAQAARRPTRFDVASIQPSPAGANFGMRLRYSPGRISAENVDLKTLIESAYGLRESQVRGPGWMASDRFNLNAEVRQPLGRDAMAALLQPYLIRQFGLVTHNRSKMVNVYALERSDGGKLMPAAAGGETPNRVMLIPNGFVIDSAGTLGDLAGMLSQLLDRPVIDATGVAGTYRYDLTFTLGAEMNPVLRGRIGLKRRMAGAQGISLPDPGEGARATAAPPPPGERGGAAAPAQPARAPSLFTVLRRQLGLKLVARKGPITVLVIDHADPKPLGN